MRKDHRIVAALLVVLGAACGGSGSTGLIAPEQALLTEVRRDGTCVTSHEAVTYCATDSPDAVAPGGATASGPFEGGGSSPTPTPLSTPTAAAATASPASSASPSTAPATSTPVPGRTGTPAPTATPCASGTCPGAALRFVVRGLPEGAACALAARPVDADGEWSVGALVPAGGVDERVDASLPADVASGQFEIALLCFEARPPSLAATIETLAEISPDVVFAPAAPITVAASGRGRGAVRLAGRARPQPGANG